MPFRKFLSHTIAKAKRRLRSPPRQRGNATARLAERDGTAIKRTSRSRFVRFLLILRRGSSSVRLIFNSVLYMAKSILKILGYSLYTGLSFLWRQVVCWIGDLECRLLLSVLRLLIKIYGAATSIFGSVVRLVYYCIDSFAQPSAIPAGNL
jgi:hypothetical protein